MVRVARGLSQKNVASRAKISANYLSLIEASARNPSTDVVQQIAGALDVPVWVVVVLGSDEAQVPREVRVVALERMMRMV
jgi:transcriptional regulator with XRE-family HTH domain